MPYWKVTLIAVSEPDAEGIRSLHERLDGLERLLAGRVGSMEETRPVPPAWRRPTDGEARWQVALCTAIAIGLQLALPRQLVLVSPVWVMPAVQGLLLVALICVNPHRINRDEWQVRALSLALAGVISLGNAWSVVRLVDVLISGGGGVASKAVELLLIGGAILLTNVIAFALWYWEFDRGGPAARARGTKAYPDFAYPQMLSPDVGPPHWEPAFVDYLYLAFTNATAFSPTDVMPMSRWAKVAMTIQSVISLVNMGLIVARAVNILQ